MDEQERRRVRKDFLNTFLCASRCEIGVAGLLARVVLNVVEGIRGESGVHFSLSLKRLWATATAPTSASQHKFRLEAVEDRWI